MSATETIQNYTAQPILLPIIPTAGDHLEETFNVNASYSTSTGQLFVIMSFMIPGTMEPGQVSIKQYSNSSQPEKIDFYAVYSSESTGPYKQVTGKFKASPIDATGNPISLGSVLSVMTMVVCSVGPKTSRGVKTNVRVTGE